MIHDDFSYVTMMFFCFPVLRSGFSGDPSMYIDESHRSEIKVIPIEATMRCQRKIFRKSGMDVFGAEVYWPYFLGSSALSKYILRLFM